MDTAKCKISIMFSEELLWNSFACDIAKAILGKIAIHILMRETRYYISKTLEDLTQQRRHDKYEKEIK